MKSDLPGFRRILRTLRARGVRYVLIGGYAGTLWGSPTVTRDIDICYARDQNNLKALAAALRDLEARLRGTREEVPFILDARTLAAGDHFTFTTIAGNLDCLGTPTGTHGFEELAATATTVDLDGMPIAVASLDDLIRMKRAAGRPKDRIEVEVLGALREEIERRGER